MAIAVWGVDKTDLLAALTVLDRIPARPGVSSSQYIRFEWREGRLYCAVAAEAACLVWMKGFGAWPFPKGAKFIDRRLLSPFVAVAGRLRTKAPFEFYADGDRLGIRHGHRRAVFDSAAPISGYGDIPTGSGSVLEFDKGVFELIECARDCATPDPSVPHLNCVYLQPRKAGMAVLATNQIVIQQGLSAPKSRLERPLPFPLYLVGLLGLGGVRRIVWRKRDVALEFANGVLWQSVSVPALRQFPVDSIYKRLGESQKATERFRVESGLLSSVVQRLAQYLGAVRKHDWLLTVSGKRGDGVLVFECKVPQGMFRERVRCLKPLSGDIYVEWPLEFLIPVFEYIGASSEDVVVRYDSGPYCLEAKHLRLVVARLASSDKKKHG